MTSNCQRPQGRFLLRRTCALFACTWFSAAAQAAPPPVAAFFENPSAGGAALSPDGRLVALGLAEQGGRTALLAVDAATLKARSVANFSDGDVRNFYWVNNHKIAYSVVNIDPKKSEVSSSLNAVNVDGSDAVGLVATALPRRSFYDDTATGYGYRTSGAQGGNDAMLINLVSAERGDMDAGVIDASTGKIDAVDLPRGTVHWLVDEKDDVRIAVAHQETLHVVYHQHEQHGWRKVASFPADANDAFVPVLYAKKTLYVRANGGTDLDKIYHYDLDKKALITPALVSAPGYSVQGGFLRDAGTVTGFRFRTDAETTIWYDPKIKALQEEIDRLLPGTINRLDLAAKAQTPFVLVQSYSPRQPDKYLLYNRERKTFAELGRRLPAIDPAHMADTTLHRYAARDGLRIPAYVTLPRQRAAGNLPMVILAPGLPWLRNGGWHWDSEAQFLASRGYAVIQPDARGTSGYGERHFDAGSKQWGLAMQDDLADAAKWAIGEGIADPKRICIAGAVYGGYAAMMGLVKHPDLFKCGISWGGIVDLALMFDRNWKNLQSDRSGATIRELVGDPERDAAQFAATSPLRQAARIRRPVLLAYGAQDVRVPASHGQKLYAALRPTNPLAEFVLYDEKGQHWSLEGNRIDLWTRIEKFLDQHIGADRPSATAAGDARARQDPR